MIKKDNQKNININYEDLYSKLLLELKKEVDTINASDYSKKSLGKFKESIENLVHNHLVNINN